jgi:predicted HAD superfamily Cof-like phosphohydrolase
MRTKTNYEKVREFHKVFGQALDVPGKWASKDLIELRLKLIVEEFQEFLESDSKENMLKEAVDLLYVIYGFAATFGLDIDTAFNRVHQSNMSKLGDDGKPIYREDGKVLKSKNYKPADLGDLV